MAIYKTGRLPIQRILPKGNVSFLNEEPAVNETKEEPKEVKVESKKTSK